MKLFKVALEKDINKDILGAADAYEKVIQGDGPIDAYINLAFLYCFGLWTKSVNGQNLTL